MLIYFAMNLLKDWMKKKSIKYPKGGIETYAPALYPVCVKEIHP